VVAMVVARMPADELAHPLERGARDGGTKKDIMSS
jgi:hypothetical protein